MVIVKSYGFNKGYGGVTEIHVDVPDFDPYEEIILGNKPPHRTERQRIGLEWYVNKSDLDPFEIMQFTGLKDKNGKEIYEGDIVNLCGRNVEIKFEVKSITTHVHGDCSTDTFVGFSLGFYGRSENFFSECEVIGNIYQNPTWYEAI